MCCIALADDDGTIDKAEFLILCMVRIGAADPNLIKRIIEHFDHLDTSGDGTLSMEEICEEKVIVKQAERRRSSMALGGTNLANIQLGFNPSLIGSFPIIEEKEEQSIIVTETDHISSSDMKQTPTSSSTHLKHTPTDKSYVPLPVSQFLRPRHISPTRLPVKFEVDSSDGDDDNTNIVDEEVLFQVQPKVQPTADLDDTDVSTADAIAKLTEAWDILNDERYIIGGNFESSRNLLQELGVYSADDLADAGVRILGEKILPLLKPVPRNKMMRLLSLDPSQLAGMVDILD